MSADDKKRALLGQMAALSGFMHVEGRDGFARLPDSTQAELQTLFNTLNDELQELIVQSAREFSRDGAVEDSSMEGV
jgi:hypothetical protein